MYPVGSDPLHHWALEHRHRIQVSGATLWMAPIEYVVLRKLQYLEASGQDKHRRNIQSMLVISGAQLDREFLTREIERSSMHTTLRSQLCAEQMQSAVIRPSQRLPRVSKSRNRGQECCGAARKDT